MKAERITVTERATATGRTLEQLIATQEALAKERELNKELLDALGAIVGNWDKNTHQREIYRESELDGKPFNYWSPASAFIETEHIASARIVLAKATA